MTTIASITLARRDNWGLLTAPIVIVLGQTDTLDLRWTLTLTSGQTMKQLTPAQAESPQSQGNNKGPVLAE